MFPDKRVEYKLYLAGLVFAAVSAAGIAVLVFTPFKIPDCTFKSVTGLYCPGCGGTRAVAAFIQGHWARSFRYHPFVPYCGILYIIFMTKGTLALFSKEKLIIFLYNKKCAKKGRPLWHIIKICKTY